MDRHNTPHKKDAPLTLSNPKHRRAILSYSYAEILIIMYRSCVIAIIIDMVCATFSLAVTLVIALVFKEDAIPAIDTLAEFPARKNDCPRFFLF